MPSRRMFGRRDRRDLKSSRPPKRVRIDHREAVKQKENWLRAEIGKCNGTLDMEMNDLRESFQTFHHVKIRMKRFIALVYRLKSEASVNGDQLAQAG